MNILDHGPGVGGHCIPIDPYFLVQDSKAGSLVRLARQTNNNRPKKFVAKYSEDLKDVQKIAILGVAYKPMLTIVESSSFAIMQS